MGKVGYQSASPVYAIFFCDMPIKCTGSAPLKSCKALVYEAEAYLKSAQERHPQRAVIYYGPRGAGKAALLRVIEKATVNMGILHARIEVGKGDEFTQ